jgi:hypothetical protein
MDPSVLRQILEKTWDFMGQPALGASSSREGRNRFFLAFCAVMHHGHPDLNPQGDPRWVAKSAGNGRPQSDDMIAFLEGGRMRGWDLIIGAGADGFRFIDATGSGEDITGQEPIVPPRSALPPTRGGGDPARTGPPAPASPLQAKATPWIDLVDARFEHLRRGSDDQQREWMARVAFVLGQKVDATIGQKRADASRPVSRNTLGVGRSGALEAIVVIDEATKARTWQSLGTIDQIWVTPPAFADMTDVLAATPQPVTPPPAPGPAPAPTPAPGAPAPAVDVAEIKRQLATIQEAVSKALSLLP